MEKFRYITKQIIDAAERSKAKGEYVQLIEKLTEKYGYISITLMNKTLRSFWNRGVKKKMNLDVLMGLSFKFFIDSAIYKACQVQINYENLEENLFLKNCKGETLIVSRLSIDIFEQHFLCTRQVLIEKAHNLRLEFKADKLCYHLE